MSVTGAVERTRDVDLTVDVSLLDPHGTEVASGTATIAPGQSDFRFDLDAGVVERWWPAGYGSQPRYTLALRLVSDEGDTAVVLDEWRRRVGFRTVRLDTSADATGSAFTFVVNELPMFVRGANWIPDDPFPSRVTSERYRQRVRQAVDANVSMLRVWGGGIYEDDAFYDICDELGVLVWQDFLFACAAYPEHLLADEVEAEARENVERLMTHPCLALWNGNNENIWGHFDWDWQPVLQGRSWGAGFYFDVLPRVVADIDPDRPYWPGSPYSGSMTIAPNADAHGCIHEWSVWNQLDHSRYRDRTPRFVAEFGWQAPPTWATLRNSISDHPLASDSPGMLHHQKALDGNGKLERGLAHHVDVPTDFDTWLWATQLNQARAVRTGVEHFRSLRGTCMGTIWWQLNDCWPVTSWAVVDGAGRRKPAWFALRDAYAPRLLTIQPRGGELVLFAVNDSADEWPLDATVTRWTFDGAAIADAAASLRVAPWSIAAWTVPTDVARPGASAGEVLRAVADGASAWWWFASDRELRYPPATWRVELIEPVTPGTLRVAVTAQTLVRDLAVMVDRVDPSLQIDRQLVSLLPGERSTFEIASGRWCGGPGGEVRGRRSATAAVVDGQRPGRTALTPCLGTAQTRGAESRPLRGVAVDGLQRAGAAQVAVPLGAGLGDSIERVRRHLDDAEAGCVAVGPLEVVEQRPHEVAVDRHAVAERAVEPGEVVGDVGDAVAIVDSPIATVEVGHRRAVLGDEVARKAIAPMEVA